MNRRLATRLATLCAGLWSLGPHAAEAKERECPVMNIESDAALRQRWPDLVTQITSDLAARDDLDPCARITLSLQPDAAIDVTVALPDGRSASRRALHQDDVVPTLHALLLIPRETLAAAPPAHAEPSRRAPRRAPAPLRAATSRASERSDALAPFSADGATGLGVELSVLSGARIGDGQASFALGALSFLDFSGWLLGFEGRADKYHHLASGTADTALELGALFGKRIRFPAVTLDVMAGPGLAMKGALADTRAVAVASDMTAAVPPAPPEASSGPVPRLLVGSRLGFSPQSVFRTFVGLEGTFGPERAAGNTSSESPHLPHWTVGLALGATLGTR